jgi:hypothetical protein
MAVDPSVVINLAAEYTGKKAFSQADTAIQKLSKNVGKLAKTLGLAFGTTAILAYSRASLRAAAADEKAQKQLALALKNVGLGRDAASSEEYIQRLQSEFGIVDDLLRPAYQTLAVATRDSDQAQKLFNLSLDISASTGRDLGSVIGALSKAFLGNNTALSKLGVGISKADLKAGKFDEIIAQLTTTFAGSATAAANTFQGSLDKLTVASANAQETIGKGLIDALQILGGETGIVSVTNAIDELSLGLSESIVSAAKLVTELQKLPVLGDFLGRLFSNPLSLPKEFLVFGKDGLLDSFRAYGKVAGLQKSTDNAHLKNLNEQFKVIKKTATITTKLTKDELAKLKAKQLQLAIDKGNLALAQGAEVFDLDKIQNEAAIISQAQQLGKATNAAQLLQIANDTARLNVKKSIFDLEDAIASKDEASIIAATKKLNADLGVLNALTGQKTQMLAIETILKDLLPKDLINQKNLDEALRKIKEMLGLLSAVTTPTTTLPGVLGTNGSKSNLPSGSVGGTLGEINKNTQDLGGVVSVIGNNNKEFIKLMDGMAPIFQTVEDVGAFNSLVKSFMGGNISSFNTGSLKADEGSISNFSRGGAFDRDIVVTIVDKTSGLIEVVQTAVQQNNRYGNNLNFAGAIPQ